MKKIFGMTLIGLSALLLGGCPVYSDSGQCSDRYPGACASSGCVTNSDCPSSYPVCDYNSGSCVQLGQGDGGATCSKPSDCPTGQSCGADRQCHPGDCTTAGCPAGYQCKLPGTGGGPTCVPVAVADGGSDAPLFTGCHNDAECASLGAGAKCLNGQCVKPADQCSDGTQCPAGEQCVSGVCTPTCDGTHPCPTGYTCDPNNGVCTGSTTPPCGAGGTACPTGTTCVEQHCVAPCGANNQCPAGLVCVDGGCIPNQIPNFVCGTEGQPGDGKPNDCATGSVCLHHNCYIACDLDAGTSACKTSDRFNQCKQVTTSTGTYSVCGSSSNLGGQCDPTTGKQCTSSTNVCIDGYCK